MVTLVYCGKKIDPPFFQIFSTSLIILHTFQKKKTPALDPTPPQISLYSNSGNTHGKNFGVAFFNLPAISKPKIKVMS
jgi:hypothetical protein